MDIAEPVMSLSDVLTLLALVGGAITVVVQLRASAKRGEEKIEELIRSYNEFKTWTKAHEKRTYRLEMAMVRLMDNANMSDSGTFRVQIEGDGEP